MKQPETSRRPPRVSVGLPVYNGENFLREAIDSILGQSFGDFELIIGDNASTDATEAICREYAVKDARVSYFRHATNLGPARNYNFVFEQARGEYFKWAAHDDLCGAAFLESCVRAMDERPELVLACPRVRIIDENGATVEDYRLTVEADAPEPHQRFYELTRLHHRCYQIFGLMRRSVLEETPLIASFANADRCLLAAMSLYGPFHEVPEYLFFARRHAQQSIEQLFHPKRRFLRLHKYSEWFDPANKGRILMPAWQVFHAYRRAIRAAPLGTRERLRCYGRLARWIVAYKNWARLLRDPLVAAVQLFGRRGGGRKDRERDASGGPA